MENQGKGAFINYAALAGIMMLSPHQVSSFMLWVNIAGVALGVALVAYERNVAAPTGRRA